MSIFQACDIRGIVDRDLTEPMARKIALAVGCRMAGKKMVVGGDIRLSTPALQKIMIEGLTESGCQVWDVGTVATPVFYYALKELAADGGVMVTASHNPSKYNGFKLVLGPQPVTDEDILSIAAMVKRHQRVTGSGNVIRYPVGEKYLAFTKEKASKGTLKVVVDAGHGAASGFAPGLFRSLGYEVVELFCQADGTFPSRPPNPALAENLHALGKKVREVGAHLGVAFDGDGDRAGFVDETGQVLDNDGALILLARHYLRKGPGTVIYDAKCSMAVPEEIRAAGGRAVMARAGHTFSKAAFLQENAVFAGEISGHFFFRELGYDDGMFAALKICEIVEKDGPLSRLADGIPHYILTPDIRVSYKGKDKEEILAEAAVKLEAYSPNRIDGVRLEFSDGWGMIRSSVTEPLFTLRFEGKTAARLEEIKEILLGALPENVAAAIREKMASLYFGN